MLKLKAKLALPVFGAAASTPPDTASLETLPRRPDFSRSSLYFPALLFVVCLAAQLFLVIFKSFNWDEFLHFSQVYQLRARTMSLPFQTVHLRSLWWAPETADNLVGQMRAARLLIWSMHLFTLVMIYGVARQFTSASNAFFASFAYLTAGYVFTHAFAIRGDPFVTATLMAGLFLMARGSLGWTTAILVGALIGLAGMLSFKAAFYAPCFVGLAWLKYRETPERLQFLSKLVVLVFAALLSFAAVYLSHTSTLAEVAKNPGGKSFFSVLSRWLTSDMPFAGHIGAAVLHAPLFFLLVLIAPFAWKKVGLRADAQLALAGFILPLLALLIYRNTFPYFFVFILAPLAIAIAPVLGMVRNRYGNVLVALLLGANGLALAAFEPRDVIARQQALIDYVHAEWPESTAYLDYSDMIADYPRILKHLTSGNGIRLYHELGDPVVAREINRGNVPFIIANHEVLLAALEGRAIPETFLPADLAAMKGNYVRQWGVLWREGKQVPAGTEPFEFHLRRGGVFVLDGTTLAIDGVTVAHGMKIELDGGRHSVIGKRDAASTLWRGDRLPAIPPDVPTGNVFTAY